MMSGSKEIIFNYWPRCEPNIKVIKLAVVGVNGMNIGELV